MTDQSDRMHTAELTRATSAGLLALARGQITAPDTRAATIDRIARTRIVAASQRPRTARERAAARVAMGDPDMVPVTHRLVDRESWSGRTIQGPRQRAYASAWRPATTLPRDLLGPLHAATLGAHRDAVLPRHNERVADVRVTAARIVVTHERAYGNGPDRGIRTVTLEPHRSILGIVTPDAWAVTDDRVTTYPEPFISAGASRRKLKHPDHVNPGQPRITGVY